ncbi:hypothetical protein JX266_014175 [Neoarthrinium moseri]|nr:hypothetical protein JX266_014175 [Neoarthrinium moseri]
MSSIKIPKGQISLAGLLYEPSSSNGTSLVIVHPGGGVKEQTASLYARKLSEHGFTSICYDASHQGESGGEPHFLEDPSARVSDIYAVIDYLERLPNVNPEKIAIVGICAGGGYAVAAARSDHRLKSLATVSMVNIGDSARKGWNGDEDPKQHIATLKMAAQQLSIENRNGADRAVVPYVPVKPDDKTPRDLREASDYYLTPRCQHPNASNKMLIDSLPLVVNFDAFHLADLYLTQPVLLIAGEEAGSKWHTARLHGLLGGIAKRIIVPGAAHMDFYDNPEFVDLAVKEIAAFNVAQH